MKTSVQPGDAPFEYRFRIPEDEPPGLYWYHPHIHGFSKQQLLGGASGALIVEGIERAKKAAAGLPERVFIIRDQDLINPNAPPAKSEPVVPKFMIDRDGDAANNGTGFGKPAKDLSINYVPVPYPDYPPATIEMRPGERQLWRVLNASAITYLNLAVLFNRSPQPLGLVAMDGVPMNQNDSLKDSVDPQNAYRAAARRAGGIYRDRSVRRRDRLAGHENCGYRPRRGKRSQPHAGEDCRVCATHQNPDQSYRVHRNLFLRQAKHGLRAVSPVRERHLYFSEKLIDPNDPTSAVEFYLTVDGQEPKMFDMSSDIPNIVAQQGTVEDWIIENRSRELHAFHIHQLHFLLLDYMGRQVNEDFLRDTVNVPYYDGRSLAYPEHSPAHGFSRPEYRGHVCLSLSSSGTRGQRHDGVDTSGSCVPPAVRTQCRQPVRHERQPLRASCKELRVVG